MSPLTLLTIAITAASAFFVKLSQGQLGVEELLWADPPRHGPDYYLSNERLLAPEFSTVALRAMGPEHRDNGQIEIHQEERYTPLPLENPEVGGKGEKGEAKRHVKLVIAVISARPDRRQAIRETWSKWMNDQVVLRFFTDSWEGKESTAEAEESSIHGDLTTQDVGGGMNFGLKLLLAMRWMSERYSFDFFLRLDDDYFLCLERLLHEIDCMSSTGNQSSPIFSGFRVCGHKRTKTAYVDEAYILLSSVVVDRIVAASNLTCSGFGSLTASAWLRVGGVGNPRGDVAWVNDYRLDQLGSFWKHSKEGEVGREQYDPVCIRGLGIHHAFPPRMHQLWTEVTGRNNTSELDSGDCKSLFSYKDDGLCFFTARGVGDIYLAGDNAQPCDSFVASTNKMWCGRQGC